MGAVLTKASSFIFIIILGYTLKRKEFFKSSDFGFISKIVLRITLPCAVIVNFNKFTLDKTLLSLVLIGITCNLITIIIGYVYSIKKDGNYKAFHIINISGYNIGCFTIPYIESFLGPIGVVATCIFDVGNAFLCTGGTYSLASLVLDNGEKPSVKSFLKNIFSSITVDTYIVMLILSFFSIKLPSIISEFAVTVGGANGFLAMLTIGIGFELNLGERRIGDLVKPLALRYISAGIFAMVFFYLLPFEFEVRKALVIVAFSPLSSICPAFTDKCKGDVALSSALNSLSILISIVIMTSILFVI